MAKKFYFALFFLMGAFVNLIQSIYFKEFLITYYGNELLLGSIIFIFFLSFAAGSYLYANFLNFVRNKFFIYILLIASLGVLALLNIQIIRNLREIAKLNPYVFFKLSSIIYYTFLVVFPASLVSGFLFPYSVDVISLYKKEKSFLSVFTCWAAGFFISGVLFSFFIYKFFNHIELIVAAGLLLLIPLFFISIFEKKSFFYSILSLLLITAFSFGLYYSNDYEMKTSQKRWENTARDANFVKSMDSQRESIALAYKDKIYDLYLNGKLKTSFPDLLSDSVFPHLVFTQQKNPKDVLVLGIPTKAFINEAQKYNYHSLDFLSENPEVNEIIKSYNMIESKNISIIDKDPVNYIKNSRKKYDLIIYRSEEPETLLLNRLYTLNLFKSIKKILNKEGVFVTSIIGDYYLMDNESLLFNKSHLNALNKVFKYCNIIPGDNIYYFCSEDESNFSNDYDEIEKRYIERKIRSDIFDPSYFVEILKKKKAEDYKIKLDNYKMNFLNKESLPIFYYYSAFINSREKNNSYKFFPEFLLTGYSKVIIFFSVLALFVLLFILNKNRSSSIIISTGFSVFSLYFLILFTFQTTTGLLYGNFGFLNGLLMLGALLGARVSDKISLKNKGNSNLKIYSLFILIIIFLAVNLFAQSLLKNSVIIYTNYIIMLTLCGFIYGFGFINNTNNNDKNLSLRASYSNIMFYISAGIAAILWGTSLFAVLGLWMLALLIGVINIALITVFVLRK